MTERPILFSAPMVRALLVGTKTQTRRPVKPQPRRVDGGVPFGDGPAWARAAPGSAMIRCPYGKAGDRLWVRETWAPNEVEPVEHRHPGAYIYRADLNERGVTRWAASWKPSIHMPRAASRITLEVTCVRVERLQDISEADAIAEGIEKTRHGFWSLYGQADVDGTYSPRASYRALWESINGAGSWDANPWVWIVEFKRVNP